MSKRTVAEINYAHITPAIVTWAFTQNTRTREDVASAIDVDVSVLVEWENSESLPTFDQAVELADCLGIPFGYLFLSKPPQRKITVPDKRTLGKVVPFST